LAFSISVSSIFHFRKYSWPPLWSSGQSSWLQIRRPGLDSRHYQKKKSSGSWTRSTQPREYNWGATWKKSSRSCLENREYGCRDPPRWPRCILYPQKLALTSSTSGARSVGIVRSRTKTMEFSWVEFSLVLEKYSYLATHMRDVSRHQCRPPCVICSELNFDGLKKPQ
jgi:hypothetical protein